MTGSYVVTRLSADKSAPAAARAFVESLIDYPARYLDNVRLLVSELVSNSIKHGPDGQGSIAIRMRVLPHTLRVDVEDAGRGFVLPEIDSRPASGFGLYLVDRLADRWGMVGGASTRVWFEIDIDDRSAPEAT